MAPPSDLVRLLDDGRVAEAQTLAFRRIGDTRWHEEALTTLARCAAARRDHAAAIRWADRNRRLSPANLSLACFLSALHLANGDAEAALGALSRFDDDELSAEAAIARAHAKASAGRIAEALALAVTTATRHPVFRKPFLASLLDRVTALAGEPGWIAADLGGRQGARLIGTLHPVAQPSGAAGPVLRLAVGDGVLLEQPLHLFCKRYGVREPGREAIGFAMPLPPGVAGRRLVMSCGGRPLPGPDAIPSTLEVEGDAGIVDDVLSGWAWLPAWPEERLAVRVSDEGGRTATVVADQPSASLRAANIGDGCHGFELSLSESGLRPGRLRVQAVADSLPLRNESLTGDPMPWIDPLSAITEVHRIAQAMTGEGGDSPDGRPRAAARAEPWAEAWMVSAFLRRIPVTVPPAPPRRQRRVPPRAARTAIVIPVYRGREETLACIASVIGSVGADAEITVIDDASPDAELSQALEKLSAGGKITLLVNPHNLGFPKTVNRGLARHPGGDVVLLNSDTLVSGDWLTRLRDAAYAEPDIGTVTPLSNDAEILSYPSGAGPRRPPDHDATAALHALASGCNDAIRVEIPTAVGFCTFIRHDCLAETGALDEELFGRGYGEENDFCLRARRLGWRHMATADSFVAHVGGRSFGRRKALLSERNLRVVNRLHPGYEALIRRFHDDDPLADARRRLDMARWRDAADTRPATLIVTFARTGGVAHFVDERIRLLTAQGRRLVMLQPAPDGPDGERRCRIEDPERPDLRDLVFRTVDEVDLVTAFLARIPVHEVEIQHYLDHDPIVLELPTRLGVPFEVYVHDYCWICPRVVLIDSTNRYCGEPDLAACERCAQAMDPATADRIPVAALRARSAAVLERARAVILPSRDVAARIARHAPRAPLTVRPWDAVRPAGSLDRPPAAERRWRVCVIGAIGLHKGYAVLLDCARDAARRDLPLDFVVVGYTQDDAPLFETGRVFVTGPFVEAEVTALLRREEADIAFFPSVCPETWSYALSHAWSAGLPAVAFDLGTIAERIRAEGGHLLPSGLSAEAVNNRLLTLLAGASPLWPVPTHDHPHGKSPTPMPPFPATVPPAQTQLNASAQLITFHPGFYSVTVVRGESESGRRDDVPLPGIHLAALPASAADVEMLGAVDGGWLFHKGDAVVVKVSRAPAQVMLTSYQRTEGDSRSLGIQISRMNGEADAGLPGRAPAVIRTQLLAHVQNNGDLAAPDGGWAGLPGQRLWIEGIAISPLDAPADCIEYKALAANGTETPWVSGGGLCGSRGMGVPLTGLAVRLKGALAERFECQYEIAFLSGARSPVLTNGQPYRSDAIGDPIQAFTLRIVERAALSAPTRS